MKALRIQYLHCCWTLAEHATGTSALPIATGHNATKLFIDSPHGVSLLLAFNRPCRLPFIQPIKDWPYFKNRVEGPVCDFFFSSWKLKLNVCTGIFGSIYVPTRKKMYLMSDGKKIELFVRTVGFMSIFNRLVFNNCRYIRKI